MEMCGLSAIHSYGISGSRLAHQIHPSETPRYDLCFCGRAYDMEPGADMVVVFGGVNDYIHGDAPFGEIGDTTPATFCGGVYFLMNYLRQTYAGKPIVFMTPARCFLRKEVDDLVVSTHARKRPGGKPLLAYVEVILATAKQFGIPVLDMYNLGINTFNHAHFVHDLTHHNERGRRLIAEKLAMEVI
jgi:lysophospholipase L1-like esterase